MSTQRSNGYDYNTDSVVRKTATAECSFIHFNLIQISRAE